jgi:hypothetical protein
MALFQFYGGWSNWGGGYFSNFVYWLDYWGVRDIILPFILIFTIFFAMLQKIHLFGATDSKKYNMVISLAVALLVVIPHALGAYPPEADVINIINDSIPEVALLVVVVVLVLMMLGMIAGKEVKFAGVLPWVSGISVVLLLFIFADAIFPFGISNYIDPAIQSLIVILLVFGLLIYWVAGEPTKPERAHWFWQGPATQAEFDEWSGKKKQE